MESRRRWFWSFFVLLLMTVFGLLVYIPKESIQVLYRYPGIKGVMIWYQSTQASNGTSLSSQSVTKEFVHSTTKSVLSSSSITSHSTSLQKSTSSRSSLLTKLSTSSLSQKNLTSTSPKHTKATSSTLQVRKTTGALKTTVSKVTHNTKSSLSKVTVTTTATPKRRKFYICPIYTGRIGNLMFQYASSYGVAVAKNMTVVIQESNILNKLFTLKAEIRKDISFCNKMKVRGEKIHCGYDPNLSNFQPTADHRLAVYLQSWKYFENVTDDLRKQFTFESSIKQTSELIINKMFEKRKIKNRSDVVLVGVHIRRGDFVNNKYGYEVATKEYFHRAVGFFTKKFINVLFIVCTNDLRWTKENMPPVSVEYAENNPAEIDMCILSLCDNTILSVGSFGWWAAWLNKGTTIYFKWPAKEGSPLRRDFNYTDYFPPKWIGM